MSDHAALDDLLNGSTLPEWPRVAEAMTVCQVMAGATVFRQDQVQPHVYGVRHGQVKLCYLDLHGNEWVKSFVGEGGFFASLVALAPGGRTSFMAVALEDSTLERVEHALLDDLASRHLAWSRALHALTMTHSIRKEQRERELLTLSAEARYRAFLETHPNLAMRIPQKDLARHLGVTSVGLNRIVRRVRETGG